MKPSLPCLACWEDDGGQDDISEATRVSPKPARVSSQSTLVTRSAGNNVVQRGSHSMADIPRSISKEDLVLLRIRSVADPNYLRQSQSYLVSDCETMMAEARKAFEARKISPLLGQFEKALRIIDQFVKGMTVLVQALDPIAQIIWGGFLMVFKNAVRFVDLIGTLSTCFETLSTTLDRFQIYSKMYSTERVTTSLGGLCACCVEFCAAAVRLLDRGSTFNFLRLIWDPLDSKFEQLRKNIEVAEKDFVQEVGLQHAKETHELAQAIKPRGPKIPCHIMSPARNRLFFPRLNIMEQIEAHFFPDEETSLPGLKSFLLHGLGGIGKTQLAANFAYSHWNDFEIIIWAVADTKQSLDDHFLQAAAALGLPNHGNASAIVTSVMNWLRDCNHNWLLIFDNVDNERLLRRFWPNSAKGSILITSRQRLLGTTMVDGACEVSSLNEDEGASMIQLLLENKVSDAQDRHLVEEMAKALGGLPLALAQMAGYLRTNHVTISEFLGNYKNHEYARTLFGRATSLDHQQHQQTLETVWRLSFEKLSPDAKNLLGIIVFLHPDDIPTSILQIREFPSGMPQAQGLHVLENSQCELRYIAAKSSLTQQSLVTYNEKELSVSIHRQVQQSALYELLDGDPENLRVAFSGAVQALYRAYPRQCPLGKPIPDWPVCQQYAAHVLHLLNLYETEKKIRDGADTDGLTLLAELLCDCGVYMWARCLFGDSERLARASIEIAEGVLEPHDCLRAQPYTLLGCICLRSENRKDEAVKSLELALYIREENMRIEYKHVEPPFHLDIQLANAYSNLGIAAKQMGEFEKAARLHEEAISIKERRRDHCAGFLLALSLHNVGKLRRLQGHIEEAVRFFTECNDEMRIYKDDEAMKARQAVWLCSLAEAEASLGREEDAEVHFAESLQILNKVMEGSLDGGMTCLRFGIFRYRAGRYEEALALLNDAEKIFSAKPVAAFDQQILSKNRLAYCLHWLDRTYAQLGKEYGSKEAQRKVSELYVEITRKQISLDPEEALEELEQLVSDD